MTNGGSSPVLMPVVNDRPEAGRAELSQPNPAELELSSNESNQIKSNRRGVSKLLWVFSLVEQQVEIRGAGRRNVDLPLPLAPVPCCSRRSPLSRRKRNFRWHQIYFCSVINWNSARPALIFAALHWLFGWLHSSSGNWFVLTLLQILLPLLALTCRATTRSAYSPQWHHRLLGKDVQEVRLTVVRFAQMKVEKFQKYLSKDKANNW